MDQKVPLLYLANDILQNSKRQGNEFVQEFWNVLPKALKDIVSQGDDNGKSAVARVVFLSLSLSLFLSFFVGAFVLVWLMLNLMFCIGGSLVFDVRDEEL